MMSSLGIENLGATVQVDGMGPLTEGKGEASDLHVRNEMQNQGMKTSSGFDAHSTSDATQTFGRMLQNSLEEVNQMQTQSDTAIKELVAGRSKNIHETMLTIERADTSLKLMMQVRNKILDAYREIMRMQV